MDKQTNPKPLEEEEIKITDSESSENAEPKAETETVEAKVEETTDENVVQEPETTSAPEETPQPEQDEMKSIEELDMLEKEYSDKEFEDMAKLYEDTLLDFKSGQVVIGKVLAVNDKEVSVDIGFKSEGTIPIDEFADPSDIVVGDNVEVLIDEIEDVDGFLVLSKKKADFMRIWEKVIESFEKGEILSGKCVRRIKGGIVVDLGGVDAFLPGSQIDVRPIRDFDALINKEMDFKIVKVNHIRKNIVVSHRVLVEEEMKGQREKILVELERGQILEGTVKNITDFGVFIDLGGVDGLLHINDLSWGRVAHPSEVVALDEKINVVILDFNEDKDRISLGLKQLQPHPWEEVEGKYPLGTTVRGKVVSISDYGAFVELEKGVEGLIHISEMSWTQHIKHPSKILAVGEMVEAKVLSIQKDERKISLGLKQLEPDPWETLSEKYPVGSRHTGKVRNLTNFGAFVELEEGIDGLIHISDLSWTKKIRHPGEVVKKGDEIEVVVLNVDKANRRISLGFKQTQDNPWDYFEDKYKVGTKIEGKVVRLIEKGLLAELPDGVDGFVPMSQLAKENLAKPADSYQIDDMLNLTVIEFNKENKKIVLTERSDIDLSKKIVTEDIDDELDIPTPAHSSRVKKDTPVKEKKPVTPAEEKQEPEAKEPEPVEAAAKAEEVETKKEEEPEKAETVDDAVKSEEPEKTETVDDAAKSEEPEKTENAEKPADPEKSEQDKDSGDNAEASEEKKEE